MRRGGGFGEDLPTASTIALTPRTPGGGAGGDGVACEVRLAFGAGAAFLPAVLEEPVFWGDVRNVVAGGEAI